MQMLKNWNPEQIREKEDIKVRLSAARTRLYELQMALKEHKIPVIVLFEGWGASGKGSTISKVIKNIDPRFFKVATMSAPTEEDLRKPFLYRYFREIPEAGIPMVSMPSSRSLWISFTFSRSGRSSRFPAGALSVATNLQEYTN